MTQGVLVRRDSEFDQWPEQRSQNPQIHRLDRAQCGYVCQRPPQLCFRRSISLTGISSLVSFSPGCRRSRLAQSRSFAVFRKVSCDRNLMATIVRFPGYRVFEAGLPGRCRKDSVWLHTPIKADMTQGIEVAVTPLPLRLRPVRPALNDSITGPVFSTVPRCCACVADFHFKGCKCAGVWQ